MSKPTILSVIKSVFAAAVGVQSDKNRQRDFEHGNLSTYIIVGIIFTVLFVALLALLVAKITG
ncbi:DUF2970 domain-containing protein [Methylotuvimicrobium buryatense]|uniref:DUF2970 domain-containing protein n=1 Tax=Methylotuvimicrobium buryatense TaxID=95641 RepID=A0A4P9URM6_METBY|nr:DUF2970 domain-containing protein [Methylotuvimicrobium buryatense]QCW84138.1 DUF2970 domain-containing protein [Methylotuvimicrobium buryatense]